MGKQRRTVWIAWFFSLIVGAWSIFDALTVLARSGPGGRPIQVAGSAVNALLPLMFVIPAALIISHQPRNTIGWLLMVPALVSVPSSAIGRYLDGFQTAPPPATLPVLLMLWFTSWNWMVMMMPLLMIPLLFPTGRPLSRRWRWAIYLAGAMFGFFLIWSGSAQIFNIATASWELINPIGFLNAASEQSIVGVWVVLLAGLSAASLASIVIRYRQAFAVERQQMKWLLFASAILILIYLVEIYLNSGAAPASPWQDLVDLLFTLALAGIAAAIAIAILRYHLFDLDVIIRLTLIYALVTGLLGVGYAGGVILLQKSFQLLTGQTSDAAVVVTTLATAALFNPLRLSVQAVIDRRFFRKKYNAEQALAQFAAAARSGSDLDRLTEMVETLVQTSLQPTQVSLYLTQEKDVAADMSAQRTRAPSGRLERGGSG